MRCVLPFTQARHASAAKAHGGEVPFLRPGDLAADIPSLKPVIVHAVREIEEAGDRADIVVVLQATSPFREAEAVEIRDAMNFIRGQEHLMAPSDEVNVESLPVPLVVAEGDRPWTAAVTDFCHVLFNTNEFLYLD